jgi:hypothetical protein
MSKPAADKPIMDMTADELVKEIKALTAALNLMSSQAHSLGLEISYTVTAASARPAKPPCISVTIKREL